MAEPPTAPERVEYDEFVCSCSEDGTQAAADLMLQVQARLSAADDYYARLIREGHLLTAVVASLDRDYDARITQIATDQWSAVWAEAYDGTFATQIDCDLVEHGVAATWRAFADRAARS